MANAWIGQFPAVRLSIVTTTDGLRETSRKIARFSLSRKDTLERVGSSTGATLAENGEMTPEQSGPKKNSPAHVLSPEGCDSSDPPDKYSVDGSGSPCPPAIWRKLHF